MSEETSVLFLLWMHVDVARARPVLVVGERDTKGIVIGTKEMVCYLDSGTSKGEEQMIFALKPKEKNQ